MSSKAKAVVVAGRRIEVTLYDRVSSLLLALLIITGAAATLLSLLWLSGKIHGEPIVAVPANMLEVSEDGEGGGDGRPAGGSQLDAASEEPFVGNDKETSDVAQELSVLGAAVSTNVIALDDPEFEKPKRQGSFGTGGGIYGGFGDGRGLGHGPGKPGWPRHWEVMFSKATLDEYAKQLDFFKIELGVIQPDNKIIYVFNVSKPKPDTKTVSNPSVNEPRYFLMWRSGEMQQADKELCRRAGVDGSGMILKFLPKEVEMDLFVKERDKNNKTPKEIRKTRFGVLSEGGGYKFYVIDQALR